jgi:hypothetical protein
VPNRRDFPRSFADRLENGLGMNIHKTLLASLFAVYAVASCSAGSTSDSPSSPQKVSGSSSGSTPGLSSGNSSGGDDGANSQDATVLGGGDDASVPSDGGPIRSLVVQDSSCAVLNNTQTSFVNLAPPMLAALDKTENDPVPGADAGMSVPAGWNYYNIDGAVCRDGSPMGIYVRYGSVKKLMMYLEGGGACMSPHFCDHNPKNMNEVFPGGSLNGESFGGSLTTQVGLQAPYTDGIFDNTNEANPFKDWSQVYIPYCTGDAHFGTNPSAMLPDGINPFQTNTWHFVGYLNMQKFVGRLVPTFTDVDQVVMTGSSAGGLGAGLNFGMVRDAFGKIPVTLVDDSFPPFLGQEDITPCLQAIAKPLWGLDKSLPSDCADCSDADKGGLVNILPYWLHKYPNVRFGLVSSIHDQIIRLFLAAGQNNCTDTDPNILSGLAFQGSDVPSFDAGQYSSGLDALRTAYVCSGTISSYYIGTGDPDASDMNGTIDSLHEHIFRPRFYAPLAGPSQPTLAQWMGDFVNGKVEQTGP